MINYYFYRFILTFNSWIYWINTPYNVLEEYTTPYSINDLYFTVREGGKTVAANFWYMINDGYYDMIDEFYDV